MERQMTEMEKYFFGRVRMGVTKGTLVTNERMAEIYDEVNRYGAALVKIMQPFQGIPDEATVEDWKSEALALKAIARTALTDPQRRTEDE